MGEGLVVAELSHRTSSFKCLRMAVAARPNAEVESSPEHTFEERFDYGLSSCICRELHLAY